MDIRPEKYSDFLSELLFHYVDKQGLGGIPKPDLDALIIYLYTEYSDNNKDFDAFSLGQKFMIKESKVKSLYETGLIKYSELTEGEAWGKILTKLTTAEFELESNEKGQIRFKFENPALYKFFHKRVQVIGGTDHFLRSSETITITLKTFFKLLNHVCDPSQIESSTNEDFSTDEKNKIRPLVKSVIEKLVSSLGEKKLKELQGKKGVKLAVKNALDYASKLSSISSFLAPLLDIIK